MTDAPQSAGLVALADRIELWPIAKLRPYERNPRTHSEAQHDQIAAPDASVRPHGHDRRGRLSSPAALLPGE